MGKMIYNGTILPDIRTVYTDEIKAEYPYAAIIFYESENVYRLCVSSEPGYVYYFLKERIQMGDTYGMVDMDASSSEWGELTFYTSETNAAVNGEATWFIWSNRDIYYPDDYSHDATLAGTIYLSASDPIPVGKPITDPVSFVMGYQLGCRLRAQRGAKKPIGYSYNGVVLPELPEWDKSKYPYAFIRAVADYGLYELYVFETEPYWFKSSIVFTLYGIEDGNTYLKASHYVGHSDYWDYSAPLLGQSALTERTSGGYVQKIEQIVWADYDILNEDKTIYLAASEPVPIYERGDG